MRKLVVLLLVPLLLFAGDKLYGNVTVSEVTSIYDGDTFRCNIKGYPAIIGEHIGIRVAGVDTPEMRDKRPDIKALAQKAKQYTVKRLREGKVIELRNMRRGKYFRIVADVWIDDVNLGDELIKAGLAHAYDGGKKIEW
ncbi:MAG: thermonuclease family protein [PVC group bacterium]|nr:thermonuclease family protein [PVC group bacterium]